MKKISFLMGVLLLASTSLFTSCFCDDDNSKTPTMIVDEKEVYTFVVTGNAPLKYEIIGDTKEGSTVKVVATATDGDNYITNPMVKEITLGNQRIISVNFEFTSTPKTVEITADDAENGVITLYQGKNGSTLNPAEADDSRMIAEVETGAEMQVSVEALQAALANGSSTAFSVIVVSNNDSIEQISAEGMKNVVAETDAEEPLETETVSFACKPDGANFGDNPVTLSLLSANTEGIEFYAVSNGNENDRVEGVSTADGKHQIQVSHFSNWDLILVAHVDNFDADSTVVSATADINVGKGSIAYRSTTSWDVNLPNVLVNAYLVGKLGPSKGLTRNLTLPVEVDMNSTVYYRIITKTVEFDLFTGTRSMPFHVKANLGSRIVIDRVVPRTTPGHSGGLGS